MNDKKLDIAVKVFFKLMEEAQKDGNHILCELEEIVSVSVRIANMLADTVEKTNKKK